MMSDYGRQPFGNRSKQSLDALVKGREVFVVERGQDRYRRTLGRIYRGDLDVNAELVREVWLGYIASKRQQVEVNRCVC